MANAIQPGSEQTDIIFAYNSFAFLSHAHLHLADVGCWLLAVGLPQQWLAPHHHNLAVGPHGWRLAVGGWQVLATSGWFA